MSIEPDEAAACIAVQPSASLACQIVGKRLSKAYISVMSPRLATSNIRATDASYRADEGEPARGAPPPAASDAISASLAAFGSVAPSAGEGIAAEERRGEKRRLHAGRPPGNPWGAVTEHGQGYWSAVTGTMEEAPEERSSGLGRGVRLG